jgi:hypothetical protein
MSTNLRPTEIAWDNKTLNYDLEKYYEHIIKLITNFKQ